MTEPLWITLLILFGVPAFVLGALVWFWGTYHRRQPVREPAPFFGPDPDRTIREFHGMNRAEWERTPPRKQVALRDQYHRALWR